MTLLQTLLSPCPLFLFIPPSTLAANKLSLSCNCTKHTHTDTLWPAARMRTYSRVLAGLEKNCRPLFQGSDTLQWSPHTFPNWESLWGSLTVLFSLVGFHYCANPHANVLFFHSPLIFLINIHFLPKVLIPSTLCHSHTFLLTLPHTNTIRMYSIMPSF